MCTMELPGICGEEDNMCVVIENESPLAIHVTDQDPIVVGCDEDQIPSMDACRAVREQRKNFRKQADFKGNKGVPGAIKVLLCSVQPERETGNIKRRDHAKRAALR